MEKCFISCLFSVAILDWCLLDVRRCFGNENVYRIYYRFDFSMLLRWQWLALRVAIPSNLSTTLSFTLFLVSTRTHSSVNFGEVFLVNFPSSFFRPFIFYDDRNSFCFIVLNSHANSKFPHFNCDVHIISRWVDTLSYFLFNSEWWWNENYFPKRRR